MRSLLQAKTKEHSLSLKQRKMFLHKVISPAQAVWALYILVWKCSKPKAHSYASGYKRLGAWDNLSLHNVFSLRKAFLLLKIKLRLSGRNLKSYFATNLNFFLLFISLFNYEWKKQNSLHLLTTSVSWDLTLSIIFCFLFFLYYLFIDTFINTLKVEEILGYIHIFHFPSQEWYLSISKPHPSLKNSNILRLQIHWQCFH